MLNLDFIRQHPGLVREGLERRGGLQNIDELLRLAEQRRGLITRCDGLYNALKPLKENVRTVPLERRADMNKQIKATMQDIRQLELQIVDIDTYLQPLLLSLPNLPHRSVQVGKAESADREVKSWGKPIAHTFSPRETWALGDGLGFRDFESEAWLSG